MNTGTKKTRGRRPGASGSREAILEAARVAFSARAYDAATLRSIAREADVDPALIGHFFGSKAGLFVAAMDWPFDPADEVAAALAGGPEQVGERLARFVLGQWADPLANVGTLGLLQAALDDSTAAILVREFILGEIFLPIMEGLDADEPRLRAGLISSQIIGLVFSRFVLGQLSSEEVDDAALIAALAPALQRYATGDLRGTA